MTIWTKAQVKKHEAALATARKWLPHIEKLVELAKVNPAIAERIAELRDARDHLEVTAATALAIDSVGK